MTRYPWGRLCTEWQTPVKTLPSLAIGKNYVQTYSLVFWGFFVPCTRISSPLTTHHHRQPPHISSLIPYIPHCPDSPRSGILHSFHWISIGYVIERETILHWRSSTDSVVSALFTKDHSFNSQYNIFAQRLFINLAFQKKLLRSFDEWQSLIMSTGFNVFQICHLFCNNSFLSKLYLKSLNKWSFPFFVQNLVKFISLD